MRIGLIGFSQGYYATTYTRHLAKLKNIDVVACCDLGRSPEYVRECAGITAEAYADEIGCKLVHDLDEMFTLDLDAVIITSEVSEHAAHTIMALREGCHVFVGKPLSFHSQEIRSVMKAAEMADRLVVPGNPLRHESPLAQIADRIRSGEIGEPTNVRVFVHHEAMIHQEWERDPRRSGGPLGTFGVYLIDTVRWMTGQEIDSLTAIGGNYAFPQIHSWDTVQAIGKTSRGALMHLNLVSTMTWEFPFVMLDIVGTKGVIRTDHDRYSYFMRNPDPVLGPIRYDPMGAKEIEHFADCCEGRSKPVFTLGDMLEAAKGIEAIDRSVRTGACIRLDDTE